MSEELTLGYVLAKIDEIAKSMDYVHESIREIGQSAADPMKAQSLADVVGYRETTNQQLLRLYEKMYDDLKCPRSGDIRERALGDLILMRYMRSRRMHRLCPICYQRLQYIRSCALP